jgi:RNA polymerase sigma factor (sigma-70 family)
MADEELLVAAREDAEAFGVFYQRRIDALLAMFYRNTRDRETAADLAAETFAAAASRMHEYDPERASALTWLFMFARRKRSDWQRRGGAQRRASEKLKVAPILLNDGELERVEERIDAGRHGDAAAILERLSEEYREVVAGHIVNLESYAELAERLQCSQAVVRQRVSRGLAHLRRLLGQP